MKRLLCLLALPCLMACSCSKPDDGNDTPQTVVPTSISVTPQSIDAAFNGGSYDLTITAPARPKLTLPSWITKKDGTFKDYKITFTLVVAANPDEEVREAYVTVMATGATDVTVKVTQAARESQKDPNLPDNTAVARSLELGLGWNMGNHMDAISNGVANETCWGNPMATQSTFDGVKAAGFTSVRIPVTWQGHIGAAPDYKIDDAWMNRVYEIVGYAENAGLKVIVNTHHDEDHGDNHWQNLAGAVNSEDTNTQIKEEIAAVWTQIANKFKEKGDFLMFESFNELIYGTEWYSSSNTEKKCDVINQWNQVFVNAVRATGGNNETRWLGVPGYAASPNFLRYLTVPNDPAKKTMLAFHCYDPYQYTIGDQQLPNWGHTGNSFPRGEEEISTLFQSIYNNYIAKDIPIYMGEYGCSLRNKSDAKAWAFYLYYLEYFVKCARTYGISAFLWDNGAKGSGQERHAYIDHGTGQFIGDAKEPVDVMVKAWETIDANYTLKSVYDSAPSL
ncbi:MAG: cellulase family glycosylhydrolase [Bacteroidales bacterium]|nr:cellulase family glycosylhydrolase [Bacteroidales bacterium]